MIIEREMINGPKKTAIISWIKFSPLKASLLLVAKMKNALVYTLKMRIGLAGTIIMHAITQ